MKIKKSIMFLIAWYLIGFYATVVSAFESYRAEHQVGSNPIEIEYAGGK